MKKSRIIAIISLIILFGLIFFFAMPNLNPLYADGLSFWCFFITLTAVVFWLSGSAGRIRSASNVFTADFKEKKAYKDIKLGKSGRVYIAVIALPWLILIIVSFFSSAIFHSAAYRDQIPKLETRQFSSDVQPLDPNQLPIVDHNLALSLADKMLGSRPDLGSQVTLGVPTIQKVNDKLVWVVPLLDSGFFKWLSNMDGTPGYIIVSATNPSDVTYVDTSTAFSKSACAPAASTTPAPVVNYLIKYQPNAYFLDNLNRHARLAGGEFTGLTDYSFEIDDTGRPYWVVTTYNNEVGFSLPEANGAIIIDATTGETKKYSKDEILNNSDTKWVDRIQPTDFITNQLNNMGQYIHGIFNFSNKDKFQTSSNYAIVYNNNTCYYFTGRTSVGSDESATGFFMVDMRTKEVLLYQMSGATDSAAQKSAEGKVQNYGYTASIPLITNVNGEPTYFMTLKDDSGLIKQYAFVSVKNYTAVGTGDTIADALIDFNLSLGSTTGGSVINSDTTKVTLEGTISRIASEQQNSITTYEFMLTEQPGTIFTANYDVSTQLALTKEGDKVKITYTKSSNSVDSFTNEALGLT
jgi:hypothetical protein